MPKCALCLTGEADKKGSHLVPHFLMKTVDNVDGKPGRELELGFEIGKGHVKGYFGGSVLPERLAPVYGEVTEEDIRDSRSSMIVDYMLCSSCEKRLANLESSYSKSLKNSLNDTHLGNENSFNSLIFWLSVFWRLSVNEHHAFKLFDDHENQIRELIDEGLDTTNRDAFIEKTKKLNTTIGYKLLRSPGYTNNNSAFIYLNNNNDRPYCMLVGEFACFLHMDAHGAGEQRQSFLGLESVVQSSKLNTFSEGEHILSVSADVFVDACRQVIEIWKNDFLAVVSAMCDALHGKFVGSGEMDGKIKSKIIQAIAFDKNPLGRKYTIPAIVEAISKTLIVHEPYRSIAERM